MNEKVQKGRITGEIDLTLDNKSIITVKFINAFLFIFKWMAMLWMLKWFGVFELLVTR